MNSSDQEFLPAGMVSVCDFGARGDGVADDYKAIQSALDSGACHVLIPGGVYLIRNAIRPHAGQTVELHGTLKVADALIRPLTRDVMPGENEVVVTDAAGFYTGQWVTLHDENLPIQGGGRKTRRACAGSARVTGITGNKLTLDVCSAREYQCRAKALLATQHSAILITESRVRICGTGVVDANKAHQLNASPCPLEQDRGTEQRAACGIIVAAYPGWVEQVVIEGLTVQDAVLLNIGLRDTRRGIIRNTICLRAHDKNIGLERLRDCLILNNIAADSEWEDGIVFHQKADPDRASRRVVIAGNLCTDNARSGIGIGAGMQDFKLSDNVCLRNGTNITLRGDNIVSSNDMAIGGNERLFPYSLPRPNVGIAGRHITLNNLIARGTPGMALVIGGTDVTVAGGLVGDMDPASAGDESVGIELKPMKRASGEPLIVPDRIHISGVTIRNCRQALRCAPETGQVVFQRNIVDANECMGDIPGQVLARLHCADNRGWKTRARGSAVVAPGQTRVKVEHGLFRAPSTADISVTPCCGGGAQAGFWLDNPGASSFEIALAQPAGAGGAHFVWQADLECEAAPAAPRIWIIGDEMAADRPLALAPATGWGAMLAEFCRADVPVFNYAAAGLRAADFAADRRRETLRNALRSGDYVLMNFGGAERRGDGAGCAGGTVAAFAAAIGQLLHDVEAAGACPVLVTPVCRPADIAAHHAPADPYAAAVRHAAEKTATPLIDLDAIIRDRAARAGAEMAATWFVQPPAGGHQGRLPAGRLAGECLHARGARLAAAWLVEDACRRKLPLAAWLVASGGAWLHAGTAGRLN